ncbi:hypothetical protein A1O3_06417 [Capronia epimyces CBS 606.96]|uniref:GH16 domain-containing protein n=1 Tax=Capronia epimyces CBS 606.96 TaxID=1182542 RepID=W9YK08_9EURO|nr:uncharacterized protein A1O3_06417 [Capronia epimyces CBS 606.96]EXJ82604.1 hypothetical protein A1O3_06417 [Capronia epimyces CBS 606.96]
MISALHQADQTPALPDTLAELPSHFILEHHALETLIDGAWRPTRRIVADKKTETAETLQAFNCPIEQEAVEPRRDIISNDNHSRQRQVSAGLPLLSKPQTKSGDVKKVGDRWVVDGVGSFDNQAIYVFDQDMPAGLTKSNYLCRQQGMDGLQPIPYNIRYDPINVQVSNGVLALTVPGQQNPDRDPDTAVSCAEITTVEEKILYASVRTNAIFSQVPGTCHGLFFYKSDCQEIDIEYLTDPTSLSNNGAGKTNRIWYTNQATNPKGTPATRGAGPAPSDCTAQVHEYRIDWTSDYTAFYIDGILQYNYSINVPTRPGPWVWNNWANGDKGWSVGPPLDDNVLRIQSIIMYYNTVDEDGDINSGAGGAYQDGQDDTCNNNGRRW